MSNFMHKVKDAVTDRRDEDTSPGYKESNKMNDNRSAFESSNPQQRLDTDPNQHGSARTAPSSSGGSNPFGGSGNRTGTHNQSKVDEPRDTDRFNSHGSTGTTGGRATNAGPHDSNLANKMDPRVDSDLDNRGNNAGNFGSQGNRGNAQGFQPNSKTQSSTGQMHTGMQGIDNHETSEESYSSSKQDRKTHREPGAFGAEKLTSEDNHSSSMQEHKSHSSTTHTKPCNMEPHTQGQQAFGRSAPGGSSYNDNRSGLSEGNQSGNPTSKLGPESNVRQARAQDQRGGY
ncbi:hypothetical protein N7495_003816 [Penicillium taxi]|uniref:uncharacterized protein n=1 Tax=Penicillium taxi TaxID=168475 RepID=UPI002545B89D|nr:uncharacterized protein N7495_003816 [Penicillium taxi]KAJ5899072.1 hypothetical protein N7495_003816 [Penicillium taxi]